MIEDILAQTEGKTTEFKADTKGLERIIKTVVAFANTAGGVIVIGVMDGDKRIVGVENILREEERLANAIADSISPQIIPDLQVISYRDKELLLVVVPHLVGPYYLKSLGRKKGVFVRLGSTNRLADDDTRESLFRLGQNLMFDELPCTGAKISDLDHAFIKTQFKKVNKNITSKQYDSWGLTSVRLGKTFPANAAILLFSSQREKWFPDSVIRCVCYKGINKNIIIDQKDIYINLIEAVEQIIQFIERHTSVYSTIGRIERIDVPQYPPVAIREAVINALVHCDYSIRGSSIQIAIYADRIEITNPGGLPFGQTMESALAGISKMRNKIIGRLFRQFHLIEKLGSGLGRIISAYEQTQARQPLLDEIDHNFSVTLYPSSELEKTLEAWERALLLALSEREKMTTKEISDLWQVTTRMARLRLSNMVKAKLVKHVATTPTDPLAFYTLP